MTTAAICATREVSWSPSLYRGEQYDSDLGLYYLRARYYNPATGRFLSRDPEDGTPTDPATLHKYHYAGGDPVNVIDPMGREGMIDRALLNFYPVAVTVYFGKCLWDIAWSEMGYRQPGMLCPVTPVVPAPSNPPPNPPKPPRCYDLNAIVDGIKDAIAASGGSCNASLLSPSENYARLALWNALLNARLAENAECSQYDPNPKGHKDQIDQIWTNIIKCEVILHEF